MVAYFDNQFLSIHHGLCEWLLPEISDGICHVCKGHKKSYLYSKLRSLKTRQRNNLKQLVKLAVMSTFLSLILHKGIKDSVTSTPQLLTKREIKSLQEKVQ